ncbi:FHA domain-containing protein, partial [Gemmiger formicilis]|uniref:FHA domain-containing protein n=1 Tax=Gemmiger formicilis TaxID=745368 RepID=UPI003D317FB4
MSLFTLGQFHRCSSFSQHCALCVRGESLLVQTLNPEAPVFVNGERIDGEHRLQN